VLEALDEADHGQDEDRHPDGGKEISHAQYFGAGVVNGG
jgi:hypothetical protein